LLLDATHYDFRMPLTYHIDTTRRLVITRGSGILKDHEVFGYQHEVWSRPDVAGFDELIDMSGVKQILLPSTERVRDLAELAARMNDGVPPTKLAIVAPDDLAFGLGRMFDTCRDSVAPGQKLVGVFRTMPEAMAFLGIDRV
jgi:hypothetical protein